MPQSSSRPFQGGTPGPAARPAPGRYIVRATDDGGALGAFIDSLGANPAIRLVETIGPGAGPPHTVVVETDPDTAEQLRRNHNQLTIEPDGPLSLFD
ncbi:hypothetical protein [Massilia yuzhufengensis]|uniref:ACT domain-containing protein n=1 Tax=Massilia yuzhufengensis TaxID=1164594 RepID=A0A1I1SE20_9BURK|nr:hypothetical protein [Massilia yuzhufengensis]SFD44745.1 hypothetical protein SAMN05216204_12555 [Massilia yuzhufengensis]